MKFGLILPNISPLRTPAMLRTAARMAEDSSFDSIWVSDHVLMPRSNLALRWLHDTVADLTAQIEAFGRDIIPVFR